MPAFDAILIGHDSLTIAAGRQLREAGNLIRVVVTRSERVRDWAQAEGLRLVEPGAGLAERLPEVDWLFSVANLDLLPPAVLARARDGAVNFHDGPLPRYAGLNAPVWAILNGETRHGISWHLIEGGVDEGRLLAQRHFDISPDETALSLNGKCFAAALESFPEVIAAIMQGVTGQPQDLAQRSYFARADRPAHAGRIDWTRPVTEILRLVRALDHGDHPNPLVTARLVANDQWLSIGSASAAKGTGQPGEVLAMANGLLTVACADGAVALGDLRDGSGRRILPEVTLGQVLPGPDGTEAAALAASLKDEGHWRSALATLLPLPLPQLGGQMGNAPLSRDFDLGAMPTDEALAIFARMMAEGEDGPVDLALTTGQGGLLADRVPLRLDPDGDFSAALDAARLRHPPPADLALRLSALPPPLLVALSQDPGAGLLPGTGITFAAAEATARLTACPDRLSPAAFDLIAARLAHRLAGGTGLSNVDRALIDRANATDMPFENLRIEALIAAQVARTPEAPALTVEDRTLSYAAIDAQANRLAHRLIDAGVRPGTPVGLHLGRTEALVIGALAIWKAGGAYVPLDPAYPADRVALYVEDSGAPVIVTDARLAPALPPHKAQVVLVDMQEDGLDTPPATTATAHDLAYLIYTSGSTGRPKGVMIEHRHIANFFAGMDTRIPHDPPGTWLAVTSLSFDISVLELFWTLARGFHVVLAGDEDRAIVARGAISGGGAMDFSLYYWGNDDGVGRDKYALLLEGAKFADQNGFAAVWTPERHFHAFGGPYPNPSVTGAAVAGITRNLAIRAGSCVAPLHHPARIAEEWAVIDNLTNGKTGLAIASGWQPDDFVLRPENTPPKNKPAMFEIITQLRRLWAGEAVEFPTASGAMFPVVTQPRPVSKSLPIWVTTAGNPETWREAGAIGANILTHLLGQSISEVADKIGIYHAALRAAGHDPADHKVTLMLHSYLAETREAAEAIAREPMKNYLRSAAGLIKQYAWAFPAFKKPKGVSNPNDVDLRSLESEELEAILDFAFLRYFDESGLFGTVEDAVRRVEELKRIGVNEVACLIDYGIDVPTVLEGLKPLAEVLRITNAAASLEADDFSLAAQIIRHGVTHLQCTPAMARMFVTNDDSRTALGRLRHLLVGGEALPGSLVADLRAATPATITNMYGPTETTIWSTTAPADASEATGPVGTPIANTQIHVLSRDMQPVAPGVAGELWIGGAGVARGYWQRPDLTADRFHPDLFAGKGGDPGRIYNTGDLARWRADGALDFLGRADHQVKLRGYRIELGEIEAALDALPGIRQSVVIAREDVPGVRNLVGYVLAEGRVDEGALKSALADTLPPQMVPSRLVRLDAFPLTPNRKIDRKALPAPQALQAPQAIPTRMIAPAPAPAADTVALQPTAHTHPVPGSGASPATPVAPVAATGPATTTDEVTGRIKAIWSRILGVEGIGPRDNFFDLGGHSLLAVQAHRDIRSELGARALTITDIFRFPVLSALVERIETVLGGRPAAPAPARAATAPAATAAPAAPHTPPAAGIVAAVATTVAANTATALDDPRAEAMARRRELRARRAAVS